MPSIGSKHDVSHVVSIYIIYNLRFRCSSAKNRQQQKFISHQRSVTKGKALDFLACNGLHLFFLFGQFLHQVASLDSCDVTRFFLKHLCAFAPC